AGIDVLPLELAPRAYRQEWKTITRICDDWHPDIVHTHGHRVDGIDGTASRTRGVATVTTVHGTTGADWKNRVYERIQRRSFRRFSAVVAVSAPLSESLVQSGVPRDRVHLVPNACEPV